MGRMVGREVVREMRESGRLCEARVWSVVRWPGVFRGNRDKRGKHERRLVLLNLIG